MKKLIYVLSFLFIGTAYAQDRQQRTTTTGQQTTTQGQQTTQDRNMQANRTGSQFELGETTDYSFNNQNYRFTPDRRGVNITRDQDGRQTPFGTLRRTGGDDGYYIMNTTDEAGQQRTSFGRFDDEGNFRSHRYDRTTDSVIEEDYRTSNPRRTTGQTQGQGTMNRNTQGTMNRNTQGTNNRTGNNK